MSLGRARCSRSSLNDEVLLTTLSSAFIQCSQNRVSNVAIPGSA